ncbi:MAG TPA: PQQ-binding-like beta-propeller repeat protein [Phycisphaerales bacterium]|nr:PQQ-binding-like beta-propeller repeat protein [Phycisphaerales bacterium]
MTLASSYRSTRSLHTRGLRRTASAVVVASLATFNSTLLAAGTVAWRVPLAGTYAAHPGAVAGDGTVYVQDVLGTVYAVNRSGTMRWTYETSGLAEGPVALGPDGTIYASGNPTGSDVTIHAITPGGTTRWAFTDPGVTQGVVAGPAVGPDGNVYAVTETAGLGVFSLTGSTGELRWSTGGSPPINERGQTGVGITFGSRAPGGEVDQCYVAFDMIGTSLSTGTLFGLALDGSPRLQISIGGDANVGQFAPAAGSATGSVFVSSLVSSQGYRLRSFDANSGGAQWSYPSGSGPPTNYLSQPTVGPDGTVYVMRNLGQIHAVHQSGSNRWIHATSFIFDAPVADPTNTVVVAGGRLTFGQPGFVKGLDVASGGLAWTIDLPDEAGVHMIPFSRPWFSPDGKRAYITTTLPGSTAGGYLYAIDLRTPACAADFNGDGALATQDIFDFLNAWLAGSPSADFSGGGLAVRDIFDFLDAWLAGCP